MPEEPATVRKLRKQRGRRVRVIIHTVDNPRKHLAEIERKGLRVQQVFRLIKAVAVEGPASAVVSLSSREWVSKIEEDQKVRTQPKSTSGGKRR